MRARMPQMEYVQPIEQPRDLVLETDFIRPYIATGEEAATVSSYSDDVSCMHVNENVVHAFIGRRAQKLVSIQNIIGLIDQTCSSHCESIHRSIISKSKQLVQNSLSVQI